MTGQDVPDGLERVAQDEGFASEAEEHAASDGPLADYELKGGGGTGVAGVVAGRVIQARGPRLVMVVGGVVGAVGLVVVAAAPTYAWFVAGMLVGLLDDWPESPE